MEKLHPKAVWLFFLHYCVQLLFLLVMLGFIVGPLLFDAFTESDEGVAVLERAPSAWLVVLIALVVLIIYFAFCYIWAKLTYKFWRYELTDSALKVEKGVIWKKYVSIPYERIQNVDIYRALLSRILGLSDLQVQTAGYSGGYQGRGRGMGFRSEGRLPGLAPDRAEQLREDLVQRARGMRQQGQPSQQGL